MPLPQHLPRLLLAVTLSLILHAAVFGLAGRTWFAGQRPEAHPPAALLAQLRPQEKREMPPRPTEPVLKDTLAEQQHEAEQAAPRSEPVPRSVRPPASRVPRGPAAKERAAQRKLAQYLFYPPEAVARGLEGEVRLLLILDVEGKVLQAQVASSSGHPLLDQAAVKAAYAMQRLPDASAREMILPVVFRLQ